MNNSQFVAIIVLSYNKQNEILECLESIFKLDYSEFEVIVVDNNSSDGSVKAIQTNYPGVHLIESEVNVGVAGGRNLGIKYIQENLKYKFILFLDDDIVVDKYALSEMVKSFNTNKNIGIVTPKCYITSHHQVIGYAGGMYVNLYTGQINDIGNGEQDRGQFDVSKFSPAAGGLCLVSKKLFEEVGIFDENFNPYGWEDVDLSLRAKKKGFGVFYNHKATVFHKGGKKGRGKAIARYEFSKSKNYFYLIKKHANFIQFLTLSLVLPFRILIIISRELFNGEFKTLFSQLRGVLSLLNKNESKS
jgi:hypothetical protein